MNIFLLVSYFLITLVSFGFTVSKHVGGWPEELFRLAVVTTYSAIYLLPAIIVAMITVRWLPKILPFAVVLIVTLTQILLITDYFIFNLFGFHINGFVINLAITPGGISSMGMGSATVSSCIAGCFAILFVNGMLWSGCQLFIRRCQFALPKLSSRSVVIAIALFFVVTVTERMAYGFSALLANQSILLVANTLPGYQPTSIQSFGKKWFGIEMKRQKKLGKIAEGSLQYPLKPLQTYLPAKPLNIVILACESLRADMLTPEIMPRMMTFSAISSRFSHHYSGGNGTRHGLFSLFYGVPGNYWHNILQQRQSPVLMDRLQQLDYELYLSTSAAFSYPEFDKTIFSKIPETQLRVDNHGEGWSRDRRNVDRIEKWLVERDKDKPFFLFHFFESSHARYYFPPESVIRPDYLEDFNYAILSNLPPNIKRIYNRYVNATHHLDSQLGRVVDVLEKTGQLDNTIVIITGDHGEEFLEHGHWGHNSEFVEEQVRVPLIVYWPGKSSAVIDYPTSHLDIAATLVPFLGVNNSVDDYSTGKSLFEKNRPFLIFSDWDRIALRTEKYKIVFPLRVGAQVMTHITTADDKQLQVSEDQAMADLSPFMGKLMEKMTRYQHKVY